MLLQPEREYHFLQLALQGAVGRQEQVLGQLLGERRAALHDAPRTVVGVHRPQQTYRVDTIVAAEAPVLDGDEGIGHIVGQVGDAHLVAVEGALLGQHRTVIGKDHDARVAVRDLQQALTVEPHPDIAEQCAQSDRAENGERDAETDDGPQEGAPAPAAGLALRGWVLDPGLALAAALRATLGGEQLRLLASLTFLDRPTHHSPGTPDAGTSLAGVHFTCREPGVSREADHCSAIMVQ